MTFLEYDATKRFAGVKAFAKQFNSIQESMEGPTIFDTYEVDCLILSHKAMTTRKREHVRRFRWNN